MQVGKVKMIIGSNSAIRKNVNINNFLTPSQYFTVNNFAYTSLARIEHTREPDLLAICRSEPNMQFHNRDVSIKETFCQLKVSINDNDKGFHKGKYGGMKNRIKDIRIEAGMTQDDVALALGKTKSQISKLENGVTDITGAWLDSLSKLFGRKPEEFISHEGYKVPVLGYVGAGGQVFPVDDLPMLDPVELREHEQMDVNCEFVDAPPGVYPAGIGCVKVRGHSQHPVYKDGEYLFYSTSPGITENCLDEDCIVQLEDGRMLVKILRRSGAYGTFDLDSYNEPTIRAVKVKWAAPIEWRKRTQKKL